MIDIVLPDVLRRLIT